MKYSITLAAVAILLLAAFAVAQKDTVMKKSDMPQAVLKAFEKAYPNSVVTEYNEEVVDGQTRHEIETKVGKMEKDFVYLPDGTLLQIEEDMSVKSLPIVIVESVMAAYPDGEIDEADKITRGSTTEYEVVVEVAEDQEYELLVSSTGQILSSEQIDDEDEDDEDAEEDDDDEEDD